MKTLVRDDLDALFEALARRGYTVVGPTVRERAIVYDQLRSSADLPIGWTDRQDGGSYRLERRDDEACFGYNVGPHSWKQFQLPPAVRLWSARGDGNGGLEPEVEPQPADAPRYAFLGARACELAAMGILDRVLLGGDHPDRADAERRPAFVVAVQCGQAGGTCFCASMGNGPRAEEGFDLALTEILEPGSHYFVLEAGSAEGEQLLAELPCREATATEHEAAARAPQRASAQMGRSLEADGIRELLYGNWEHPRWDEVAERCLSCGNCTMVCPTCFCTSVEDVTDLAGEGTERWQSWASCFTVDYSYLVGGSMRRSTRSRYRQWMTHKLATWFDQFGSSGCVGCGRCITWCPVGIDITEEARAIRATDRRRDADD